jgi:hypothetical protein
LITLARIAAWPSAGWSQTCNVQGLLQNWANQLKASWQKNNPDLIVDTYQPQNGVLLPTCSNGPLVGRRAIKGYFEDFLKLKPEATFEWPSAHCTQTFASGLYSFKVEGGQVLRARYTYIFTGTLIAQHHSSLEPKPPAPQGCPSH